ncbi:hypothetical protein C8R44DRAFT_741328 [Mycena epipterygia]|nr:hypothetical protein C8R44DRAFT_741328 [Mycena epipterygia]
MKFDALVFLAVACFAALACFYPTLATFRNSLALNTRGVDIENLAKSIKDSGQSLLVGVSGGNNLRLKRPKKALSELEVQKIRLCDIDPLLLINCQDFKAEFWSQELDS